MYALLNLGIESVRKFELELARYDVNPELDNEVSLQ